MFILFLPHPASISRSRGLRVSGRPCGWVAGIGKKMLGPPRFVELIGILDLVSRTEVGVMSDELDCGESAIVCSDLITDVEFRACLLCVIARGRLCSRR